MPPLRTVPPAYLLTWTTYGTWLHGSPKGSVDLAHNRYGTPCLAPDPEREARAQDRMTSPPMVLSSEARAVVDLAIRDHVELRKWRMPALNVRSNHVHVVVASPTLEPEPIVKQLKEWSTRRLRAAGLVQPSHKVWTRHASTRFLFEPNSLDGAIRYVLYGQD